MRIVTVALGLTALLACDPAVVDTESDTEAQGTWFATCGDPVCRGYEGPFEGVPLCTDEVLGDECGELDVTCDAGDGCNALVICAEEDPTASPVGCPRSTAKTKTDIVYLTPADHAQALEWLKTTRLATWKYRDDADAHTHMGFIIDDQPTSAAVRPDGEHVDLYGYTSLAVSAMQAQQAQIDVLTAELAEVRAEMARMQAE